MKLTREEHIARAMLLGCLYNHQLGYYFRSGPGETTLRFDAFTLEPLDMEEVRRRRAWRDNLGTSEIARGWHDLDT